MRSPKIQRYATAISALLLWATALPGAVPALGQSDTGFCRRHHPWGEFNPGAWKFVRVVTETLDPNGTLTGTSTTDTRTLLVDTGPDTLTLRQSVTVEVAGKRFEAEPKTVVQGFCGQRPGQSVQISEPRSAEVTIEQRAIDCRVQRLTIGGQSTRTVTNVYFSDEIEPHVLKRETIVTDPEDDQLISESTMEVLALNMPFRVLTKIQTTAQLRTVHKHPKGTVVTTTIHSPEVPGGVIAHWSKELDKRGNVVRRSTLELLDYGLSSEEVRTGILGRRRRRVFRSDE